MVQESNPPNDPPDVSSKVFIAPAAEVWYVNPLIVNFNPGTKAGQIVLKRKQRVYLWAHVSLQDWVK